MFDVDHAGVGAAIPLVAVAYASRSGFQRVRGWVLGRIDASDELADHSTSDPFAQLDTVLGAVAPGSEIGRAHV